MNKVVSIAAAGVIIGSLATGSMALEISAGIKGGLGIANLRGSDAEIKNIDKSPLFGVVGGAALNITFSDILGAEVDFLYAMKGQKYSFNYATQMYNGTYDTLTVALGSNKGNYNLSYLDIPILLKIMIPLQSSIKPYFSVGPSFGLLLSSKEKASGTGVIRQHILSPIDSVIATVPVGLDTTIDRKGSTNPLDIGIVLGAGTSIAVGPGDCTVDVRYSFGFSNTMKLTDADKATGFTEADLPGRLNSLFTVMVGYCYKF